MMRVPRSTSMPLDIERLGVVLRVGFGARADLVGAHEECVALDLVAFRCGLDRLDFDRVRDCE